MFRAMNARQPVPLRPDRAAIAADWRRSFIRASTAKALSQIRQNANVGEILQTNWPDDERAEMILRSPTAPLTQSGFPSSTVVQLMLLAPQSAAARLFELAVQIDLTGITQFSFPLPTNFADAVFIEEGFPIPVREGDFVGMLLGPVRKLALIGALTNELERASGNVASTIISHVLEVAVGNGLAKVLFSANAASTIAPAGLLFGATAVTGSANMAQDLGALVEVISAAGIDTSSVVFVCSSPQALAISLQAGPHFTHRIIEASSLEAGTVIAISPIALAVAGSGTPIVDIGKHTTAHFADPASPISATGAPATIAAPTYSTFQMDAFVLRCVSRITWSAAPGAVAAVTGATWGTAAAQQREQHDG